MSEANPGNPLGRTGAALDPRTGLTPKEREAARYMIAGAAPQTAASLAGYAEPVTEAKRLRAKQKFTDFVLRGMREKVVRYHEMLELSKQNIVYLLSSDDTDEKTRAAVALGVLRVLAKTGRDGKTLIERALEEDKTEADPRVLAQRLIASATAPLAPELPGAPQVITIDAEETR